MVENGLITPLFRFEAYLKTDENYRNYTLIDTAFRISTGPPTMTNIAVRMKKKYILIYFNIYFLHITNSLILFYGVNLDHLNPKRPFSRPVQENDV